MAFEETREQQQMYNYFRSCIVSSLRTLSASVLSVVPSVISTSFAAASVVSTSFATAPVIILTAASVASAI